MAKPKPPEVVHRQMHGDPFEAYIGLKRIEVAIYVLEGYGHRIIPVDRNPSGSIKPPSRANCLHGRPIQPNPMFVKFGDRKGYAQICSMCAWETGQIESF